MSYPTTVEEIVARIKESRRQLDHIIISLNNTQMREPVLHDGWSVKDIMAHIAFWDHRLIHTLHSESDDAMERLAPPEIADIPYEDAWQWTDAVNERIYQLNFEKSLNQIRAEYEETHENLIDTLNMVPDDYIFDPDGISAILGFEFAQLLVDAYEHYEHHGRELESVFKQ